MPPTMNDTVDNLANQLDDQNIEGDPDNSVSFAGAGLKLNTHVDASPIVDAIRDCPRLTYLNLEGNTLGVEAAEAISEALTTTSHLSHAILKDIFTGRLKTEVPHAVRALMVGIGMSKAHLVELDLSDNAFGPIGMEALAPFLESESSENLRILRLNNNGLGIGGGKILGKALTNLKHLEVFICGRNRLENPGSQEIGGSLAGLNSLKQIEMPQNGIHLPGIEALSKAIKSNLKILNLSDNTMTVEGGRIIADALRQTTPQLETVNFSDCLLKKEGFTHILTAMEETGILKNLRWLDVSGNEIGGDDVADLIVKVFSNENIDYSGLTLNLSSNCFGESNSTIIMDELNGMVNLILEEDEGDQEEYEYPEDYLEDSTDTGGPRPTDIDDEIRELVENEETTLDQLCSTFVKVTIDGFDSRFEEIPQEVQKEADLLLKTIVAKSPSYDAAQSLAVHMGLLKSEEGYHKKPKDLRGPFMALTNSRPLLHRDQVEVFQFLLSLPNQSAEKTGKIKHRLLQALFC